MTNKLNSPFLNSKVKSNDVKKSEKWLGYLLGPVAPHKILCK